MKVKIASVAVVALAIAAVLALSACSQLGSFSAEQVSTGHIIATADKGSGNSAFEMEVDAGAQVEISSYVDSGTFDILLANGKDANFGTFTLGEGEVHRTVSVDAGHLIIEVHADHATGTLDIQTVYVEDDPKVSRS